MSTEKRKKKAFTKKLLHKYRLVILNEDTFEERLSFKLTRLNVFILMGISAIILIALTTVLIAFTPIREYIPGYSSERLKEQASDLSRKTDSIIKELHIKQRQYDGIRNILSGNVEPLSYNEDTSTVNIDREQIDLSPSAEDSILRELVAKEDKYNLFETATADADFVLFTPLKGKISDPYDQEKKHYAIDIAAKQNTPVKAVADGTVIFAEWTAATGNVIIIEHANNLISAYKHNSSLSKEQGDLVKAGEVIAAVGNTGELTTGPHLHFELWSNGYPINPTNFIDFE